MAHRRHLIAGLVVLGCLVAGCGGDGGGEATTTVAATTTTSPAGPRTTGEVTTTTAGFSGTLIQVRVSGGKVQTAERRVRVARGGRVRVQVQSDQADEVHVHGYDLSKPVGPGSPATVEFAADLPGVFEVELEGAKRKLFELEVR